MREHAWAGDWPSFEQAQDSSFEDLGYDSLARMETHTRLRRQFNVTIEEDDFDRVATPRTLVDFVNSHHSVT
nr:acyl carrier protein [Kineosporia babensis]